MVTRPNFDAVNFDPDTDVFFTTKQVADLFEVTPETVSDWINQGKLRAAKRGRRWLIRRADVITYANSLFGAKT